ncbi:hypothetical protein AN641_06615 [Candidatus Epulonipiscioides gigas]|nr:hypothetical protein AN641_06615 [Epulopiscium sp. SCG-C07WGA-EpuloA2]
MDLNIICTKFMTARDIIEKFFTGASHFIYPVCASIFLNKDKMVDTDKLTECTLLLDKYVDRFYDFDTEIRPIIISILSTYDDAEGAINKAIKLYNQLKLNFVDSTYIAIDALIMIELVDEENFVYISQRAKEIYKIMESAHKILTSSSDIIFALLMSLSDKQNLKMILDAEEYYLILKKKFASGDPVQTLSHVLALYNWANKCTRVIKLYDALKSKGYVYGTNYELPSLGTLAMMNINLKDIIDDFIKVDKFLAKQNAYRSSKFTKKQRFIHSAMLVIISHSNSTINTYNSIFAAITMATQHSVVMRSMSNIISHGKN